MSDLQETTDTAKAAVFTYVGARCIWNDLRKRPDVYISAAALADINATVEALLARSTAACDQWQAAIDESA